ncbi:MAG: glycosyltransferase [Methanobacterium sp.]|jgi:glycosyltransferase involved in cell wall biosynthesis
MKAKISIIVPVYNVENYIRNALDSIVIQTIGLGCLKVIMVDDCSTDHSGEIIDEYASNYANFTAIHLQENSGSAGKPRNIGIERSTCDYLMFLDADDYYAPDACEVLYNNILDEDVDIVFGNYMYMFENRTQKNHTPFENIDKIKVEKIDDEPNLFKLPPSIWTKIFKRKFITDNNLNFPERIPAQDLVFTVLALLKANGIIYLNNFIVCNYNRIRDSKGDKGISRDKNKKNLLGMIHSYNQTFDILKDHGKENYFPLIFDGHLQFWIEGFISSDLNSYDKKELLEETSCLFEEFKKYNAKPKKYLRPLFTILSDKRYDEAILLSEVLSIFIENENNLRNKLNAIENKLKSMKELIRERENDLIVKEMGNNKEKRIEELNSEVNTLTVHIYELEFQNNHGRSFYQRFTSKFPGLYIFLKGNTDIKNALINIKGYNAIKNNNLFDIGYYLTNYRDVKLSGMDPLIHYLYHGFKEGKNPSPKFDNNKYLKTHPDVKDSNLNPLVHYSLYGTNEGRTIDSAKEKNDTIKKILEQENVLKTKIAIKIPVPKWKEAHEWGDYHLAVGLKKELENNNCEILLQILPEWNSELDADCDVVIVLRGLSKYKPKKQHFNIMWNISHPDDIKIEEYNQYDHVFIASGLWAQKIKESVDPPVESLLQCTDPELFYPDESKYYQHDLLFVGNSRKIFRKVIKDLLPTNEDLAVYGNDWGRFINRKYIKGKYIPYTELRKAYSSCKILLNDHWDDMREKGFISNRIFDAFAAGAFIISDNIQGAEDLFGEDLVKYNNPEDLNHLIDNYLNNEEKRIKKSKNACNIVLKQHTYQERVKRILEIINLNLPNEKQHKKI